MFRIVQVNRSESTGTEFILLQNQGNMRLPLHGLTVMGERAIETGDLSLAHVFSDDEMVPPGAFVLLHSGPGEPAVTRCKDGLIYRVYMNRTESVWATFSGSIHVLAPHHTYVERSEPLRVNHRAIESLALAS